MANDANRRSATEPIGVSSVIRKVRPDLGEDLVAACTVEPVGTFKRNMAGRLPLGSLFVRRKQKLPRLMTLALTRDRLYLYRVTLAGKARRMDDWPVATCYVTIMQGRATATIALDAAGRRPLEVEVRTLGARSSENKAFLEVLARSVPPG